MPAKIGRRLQQTLSGSAADRGFPIALTRQATGCHHARTQAQRQGTRALIDRRGGPRKLCPIQARSAVWLYDDHGRRKAAMVELENCVNQQGRNLDHILMLRPKPAKATATCGSWGLFDTGPTTQSSRVANCVMVGMRLLGMRDQPKARAQTRWSAPAPFLRPFGRPQPFNGRHDLGARYTILLMQVFRRGADAQDRALLHRRSLDDLGTHGTARCHLISPGDLSTSAQLTRWEPFSLIDAARLVAYSCSSNGCYYVQRRLRQSLAAGS
jgi:hypothetical protein